MRSVVFVLAYVALLVVGVSAYEGKLDLRLSGVPGVPSLGHSASPGLCGTTLDSRLDYSWPVRPFDEQHPIRGNFGDPRTISTAAFGADTAGTPGQFSFHNGVDIAAPVGTKVYPVVSGWGTVVDGDEVAVQAGDRIFEYRHINPVLRRNGPVVVGVTVLGTVKHPADHVHLTELDGFQVVDPLLHLRPYVDHTKPSVQSIAFLTVGGRRLQPDSLRGRIVVLAKADDRQSIPVPGTWNGFPITPALVEATLLDARGTLVWRRVVSDFVRTEPVQSDFWRIYGPGTYQNFPVFGHRYYWKTPGRYVFRITSAPLDTRRLPNGRYELQVSARDLCGNEATVSQPISVDNGSNGLDTRDAVARSPRRASA